MTSQLLDGLGPLFEGLPDTMFCGKDRHGRYLAVNQAFADRVGRTSPAEVVGATAADLFPDALAGSYDAQDQEVLAGHPVRNHLELILRPDGSLGWYLTNKVLLDDGGEPLIVSVSVDLASPDRPGQPVADVAAVVDLVEQRFAEPLTVGELAAHAGCSVPQLERRVKRVLGVSPKQLLLRTRLQHALDLLRRTDLSVGDVAARCGYYDQSALTRQFHSAVGLTPGQYRRSANSM